MSAVLTRPHRNLETVNSLFTFDDVQVDPGGLDVVRRALVRARVPRGRRPRDRQPRVDGVVSAVERRLHLGVPRRRRRDPLAVLEPATKPHFIIDVTGVAPFNKKLPPPLSFIYCFIPEDYLWLLQPVGDVAAEDHAAAALHVHLGVAAVYPHSRHCNGQR